MTQSLSPLSTVGTRVLRGSVDEARSKKPVPRSSSAAAASTVQSRGIHGETQSTQRKPSASSSDPWAALHKPVSTTERATIDRQLSRLAPPESACSAEGQRGKLEKALKQSEIACFDIGKIGSAGLKGPQFSASIHPTKANVDDFIDQLYHARTQSVVDLARPDEYGLKDPAYFDTGGEQIKFGKYLVTGREVGRPVSLGMNVPAEDETSQPITLRFYEMTIVPKDDADNPAAVRNVRGFNIDQLTDGTTFEAGYLTKLAMQLLKAGSSSIHVHCHGGFDRTGMTVVLSQFIDRLLRGERMTQPLKVLSELLENFRASRDEPTAVQGKNQLAALAAECIRLAAMPRRELLALFKSVPPLGVEPPAKPSRPRRSW